MMFKLVGKHLMRNRVFAESQMPLHKMLVHCHMESVTLQCMCQTETTRASFLLLHDELSYTVQHGKKSFMI
jgi:hypothetical protein